MTRITLLLIANDPEVYGAALGGGEAMTHGERLTESAKQNMIAAAIAEIKAAGEIEDFLVQFDLVYGAALGPNEDGKFALYVGTLEETPSGWKVPRRLITSAFSYNTAAEAETVADELIAKSRGCAMTKVTVPEVTTARELADIRSRAAVELRAIAEETRALNHRWANAASVLACNWVLDSKETRVVQGSTVGYHLGAAVRELVKLAGEVEKLC